MRTFAENEFRDFLLGDPVFEDFFAQILSWSYFLTLWSEDMGQKWAVLTIIGSPLLSLVSNLSGLDSFYEDAQIADTLQPLLKISRFEESGSKG